MTLLSHLLNTYIKLVVALEFRVDNLSFEQTIALRLEEGKINFESQKKRK